MFFGFFLKPVYPTMIVEKFKLMVLRLLENTFVSQKAESVHSYSCPQTLSQVFIITTQGRRKLPISPEQHFLKICFSPAKGGKDYGAERMTNIKLAKTLVTSFDKFHLFSTFATFLVSVLLCERFFNLTSCSIFQPFHHMPN